MAATKPRALADELRVAADRLYVLAERAETPARGITARQQLHDDIEILAGHVRASVRGRG